MHGTIQSERRRKSFQVNFLDFSAEIQRCHWNGKCNLKFSIEKDEDAHTKKLTAYKCNRISCVKWKTYRVKWYNGHCQHDFSSDSEKKNRGKKFELNHLRFPFWISHTHNVCRHFGFGELEISSPLNWVEQLGSRLFRKMNLFATMANVLNTHAHQPLRCTFDRKPFSRDYKRSESTSLPNTIKTIFKSIFRNKLVLLKHQFMVVWTLKSC